MEVLLVILFCLGVLGLVLWVRESRRERPERSVMRFFMVLTYASAILFLFFIGLLIIAHGNI